MASAELQAQIQLWRQKSADGTMTLDEMKLAIKALRGDRMTAAAASDGAKRTKAKVEVRDAKTLLGQLKGTI